MNTSLHFEEELPGTAVYSTKHEQYYIIHWWW